MSVAISKNFQRQCEESHKAHIESWKKSSLSKAKYCFQKGLSLSVFSQWCVKLDKKENAAPTDFIPIAVKSTKQAAPTSKALQVEFSNGVKVTLPGINNIRECLLLLRGL